VAGDGDGPVYPQPAFVTRYVRRHRTGEGR
jgi:hypothetical protein